MKNKQQETRKKLDDLKNLLNEEEEIIITSTVIKKEGDNTQAEILTAKQLHFVEEYVKDFNGTQAAIRAGYSKDSAGPQASSLLKKDNIQTEIAKRQALLQEASNITKEGVIKKLLELIEDCYNDEKTDRTSILKAMDMINKMTGMYVPENQINIQNNNDGEIKITIIKPE